MPFSWVIVGCGYTGTRLARRLVGDGHHVIATRRDSTGVDETRRRIPNAEVRRVSLQQRDSLRGLVPEGAKVVVLAPPGTDEEAESALVAASRLAHRMIYVSSTGVYSDGAGGWVDEDFQLGPLGERGRRRLRAERSIEAACNEHNVQFAALRAAGIYGPGRGVHFRMQRGDYRIVGDGTRFVSRIHVDDLVSAIVAAAQADPLPFRFFNVADNTPTTSRAIAEGVAELLDLDVPPSMSELEASPVARAMLTANRKIDNRRLRESLGVDLCFPSWREGVLQAVEEESQSSVRS